MIIENQKLMWSLVRIAKNKKMIETINNIIDFLGIGNVISIVLFTFGTFIAFYFYYRTFYRLVYSTDSICKDFKNLDYRTNEDSIFESRVVFYNNGRKTLTKTEANKLEIVSTNEVLNVRFLKGVKNLNTDIEGYIIRIDFEYLDSNDFFVIEVIHKGQLEIKGRISETGEILHTETKIWTNINIAFLIFFIAIIGYNTYSLEYIENSSLIGQGSSLILIIILFCLLRYIHKLFFIPDNISSKYLVPKDKWYTEFRKKF